ncbi:MAG TPA: SCO family protein [Methylomirabilota bacterium]|nr:SCO family protein [Methylomirabilota bacterium]
MSALRIVRLATWALVIALTFATAIVLWRGDAVPPSTEDVAIGGPFNLVDTDGQTVTEKSLEGRPHAIFFGFTHCPEVCPTTLSEISVLVDDLGPDGEKLDVYFVTVDPERDDPQTIKSYLSSFSGKIEGLTGTEDEIATIATAYKVYRRKVPTDGGDYTMDHSASVYLFGADGRFRGTIAYGENHDDALAKLKRLVS